MTTRLTLFTATLVQESALSVSGLDREASADQPFTLIDGIPVLSGRGLKGAAVAMAKRFFDPFPRAISDDIRHGALRRSTWEFSESSASASPRLRAGVGIRHKTGARAEGVLYDREVIPAGTRWPLRMRVDRSYALDDAEFAIAEGILGYVLEQHWAQGRCWLGGGAARGLGWCRLEMLQVYRLDDSSYPAWVASDRTALPAPLRAVPTAAPTRSWFFRSRKATVAFGEYRPVADEAPWGLDMLAVGPHDSERAQQAPGDGHWARPPWATGPAMEHLATDRALLMDGDRPLLPGSSVRGPLRHAYSRALRAQGIAVEDPHLVQGKVAPDDPGGNSFGSVQQSSRILIRDARAEPGWAAAKLHMHAEDEFSAGSYGSAKRDAVRLLKASFPVQIVIEGQTAAEADALCQQIDGQLALGELGHLPVGGHKTRGAGWGRWHLEPWQLLDIIGTPGPKAPESKAPVAKKDRPYYLPRRESGDVRLHIESGRLDADGLTLYGAAAIARRALGDDAVIAWWCDPANDLHLDYVPATYGNTLPERDIQAEELAFYAERGVWRAARTSAGPRFVCIREVAEDSAATHKARVRFTPARLHGFNRFSAINTGKGAVLLREWHADDELLGYTLCKEQR